MRVCRDGRRRGDQVSPGGRDGTGTKVCLRLLLAVGLLLRSRRRLFFEPLEERSLLAAVITVNSILDTNVRDSALTLREAILINNRTLAVGSLMPAELRRWLGRRRTVTRTRLGSILRGAACGRSA